MADRSGPRANRLRTALHVQPIRRRIVIACPAFDFATFVWRQKCGVDTGCKTLNSAQEVATHQPVEIVADIPACIEAPEHFQAHFTFEGGCPLRNEVLDQVKVILLDVGERRP